MNMLKALFLGCCAIAVVSCSDDDTTGPDDNGGTKDNAFASKQGDYSTYDVYRLDENNETISTTGTYSTRTVLQTNVTFSGKSDVTMVVDSLFMPGSSQVERVDTVYYRIDNNNLYIYNFAATFISFIPPDFPLQLTPVPAWIKVAELKETSSEFTHSDLKVNAVGIGELPVTITAKNKGKQVIDGYTVFHHELTASGQVKFPPLIDITVDIPIILDIGGVKNAANSPSTVIKMQINKFSDPSSGGSITGRVQTLSSFHAGS